MFKVNLWMWLSNLPSPDPSNFYEKEKNKAKDVSECLDYQNNDNRGHNKLWKVIQQIGIPDHLTCLLRNLYAAQEAPELDMEQQICSK